MITSRKKRLAIGLALTSTLGAGLLTGSANADPQQYTAFAGVGSDTTEGVMNAMAGFSNGRFYSFNADLTERWSIPVPNINIGAPAIGRDGTLKR